MRAAGLGAYDAGLRFHAAGLGHGHIVFFVKLAPTSVVAGIIEGHFISEHDLRGSLVAVVATPTPPAPPTPLSICSFYFLYLCLYCRITKVLSNLTLFGQNSWPRV